MTMRWKEIGFEGWGRGPSPGGLAARPERRAGVGEALAAARASGSVVLARGAGRAYGDAARPAGGRAILTARLDRMLAFDPAPAGTAPLVNVTGAYKRTDAISRVDLGPLAEILAAELGR